MKKNLRLIITVLFAIGLLTFSLSSIFRDSLSDFALGFFEGISVVFIVVGFIYNVWHFFKIHRYDTWKEKKVPPKYPISKNSSWHYPILDL